MTTTFADLNSAVLRFIFGGIICAVVLVSPVVALIVLSGVAIWCAPYLLTDFCESQCAATPRHSRHELADCRIELAAARAQIVTMSFCIDGRQTRIALLEKELELAREGLRAEKLNRVHEGDAEKVRQRLYARLGLTPEIPQAFLPHLKRAILLSLHPDRHPEHRKAAAHERFIAALTAFAEIEKDRSRV